MAATTSKISCYGSSALPSRVSWIRFGELLICTSRSS
jgi:hypothetical protein